jgi:hypothetical protein
VKYNGRDQFGIKKWMSSSWATGAGGISALTAHDAGSKVLALGEDAQPGRHFDSSGGGVALRAMLRGAFQYLKRTCNGTHRTTSCVRWPKMVGMIDWVTDLAKVSGTRTDQDETRGHAPSIPWHQRHRLDQAQGLSGVLGISLGQRTARRCAALQSCLRQCQRAQDRSDAVDTSKGIDHREGRRNSRVGCRRT